MKESIASLENHKQRMENQAREHMQHILTIACEEILKHYSFTGPITAGSSAVAELVQYLLNPENLAELLLTKQSRRPTFAAGMGGRTDAIGSLQTGDSGKPELLLHATFDTPTTAEMDTTKLEVVMAGLRQDYGRAMSQSTEFQKRIIDVLTDAKLITHT